MVAEYDVTCKELSDPNTKDMIQNMANYRYSVIEHLCGSGKHICKLKSSCYDKTLFKSSEILIVNYELKSRQLFLKNF